MIAGVVTLILGTYVNLVEHTSSPAPALQQQGAGPAFVKPVADPFLKG